MDFRNAVQLVGDYHHVEVSPEQISQSVRLQVLKFQMVRT